MTDIIKSAVLMAAILIIGYFSMGYMGYEVNSEYFTYSKKECQSRLRQCGNNILHQGIDNAKCDIVCVDPELIIKKKK